MENDSYRTIAHPTEGFYKEKGSKFLAFAYPVVSEEQVGEIQKELRKKYYDARHHVYAFRLLADGSIFRASDDGEPSNSSGPPVLGQIRSYELTQILIIVIRYFGGTKLGIPGLINAYKTAAKDAIDNARIIEKTVDTSFAVEFPYESMNDVMRVIKETTDLQQINHDFGITCSIELSIRKNKAPEALERFRKIRHVKLKIEE